MASQNATPGGPSSYGGGYGALYGAMHGNNSMTFNAAHQGGAYSVPSGPGGPATPPVLPPLQSNPYAADGSSGFQFSYQGGGGDVGSATPS
ncbi:hypothetical protein BGZ70_003435, partial [Mortierella alpina]